MKVIPNTERRELSLDELRKKIDEYSIPVPEAGCWLWLRSSNHFGHGRLAVYYDEIPAHRAAWIAYIGPIPDGLCVCHKCDTPSCVNPAHLFLGTRRDNNLDMFRKNRCAKGIHNQTSKLSDMQSKGMRYIDAESLGSEAKT